MNVQLREFLSEWKEWTPALALLAVFVFLGVMFLRSAHPISERDCIRDAHPAIVLEACRNVQK